MTELWLGIIVLTFIALAVPLLPLVKAGCANGPRSWPLMAGISLLLPLLAISLYLYLGESRGLAQQLQAQQQKQQLAKEVQQLGDIKGIIAKLKQRLEQTQDPYGWLLLGRLYLKTQAFSEAEAALAQAKQLAPQNTDILLSYAQAYYFQHGQNLNQETQADLMQVLQKDPQQGDALNLLALSFYKQGNLAQALHYWRQLLSLLPPEDDYAKMLRQQIATVEQKTKSTATAGIALKIQVTLSPALRQTVNQNDTVFIYAQNPQGPPMPLAVTRRQVKDLPLKVVLDESMAMLPDMTLASVPQVKIVARISKTGQAVAAAGDLIGEQNAVDVRHPPAIIQLEINRSLGN